MDENMENFEELDEMENDSIVELIDENGESVQFEHLDTLELDGVTYLVLTPYIEDAEESDVFIMKIVEEDGEEILVTVEDQGIIKKVFDLFRERTENDFDFID